MTDRYQRHPEIDPDGPPLEWFEGRGPEDGGIEHIFPSQTLRDMGGGEVGLALDTWGHLVSGTIIEQNGDEFRLAREALDLPVDSRARAQALSAETVVRIETGFTPLQLSDRRVELLNLFKGQTSAPFSVILWPQREE